MPQRASETSTDQAASTAVLGKLPPAALTPDGEPGTAHTAPAAVIAPVGPDADATATAEADAIERPARPPARGWLRRLA